MRTAIEGVTTLAQLSWSFTTVAATGIPDTSLVVALLAAVPFACVLASRVVDVDSEE